MSQYLTADDLRAEVVDLIHASGLGQNEWARQHGININSLSDFLCKRRVASPALRAHLRLNYVEMYERVSDAG